MSAYDEHNRKHRRLSILKVLFGADGYTANDSLITTIVNEFGLVSTRDQVRTDLTWLREQGFVSVREISDTMVATMTEAGSEIVQARRTVPGIAKPSPKG